MSKRETPMTRWYWQQVGGTLVEEFVAVQRSATCAPRLLDGVIITGGETRIARRSEVSLEGKDVIVVQTKASRLGHRSQLKALPSPQKRFWAFVCV